MKKIKYITLLIIGGLFFSCSDEVMDEINKNPNNPTDVPSRLVITDALNRSIVSVTNGDYAFYASLFVEHQVGIFNQFYNVEIRNDAAMIQSTTYNNAWNSSYLAMRDLKDVITKCSDGGSEAGNYHTLGTAQVMMAYNLAVLTDACGDVPWSQALDPVNYLRPQLDKQEDIYNDIFKLLDDGIANLEKTPTFPALGAQDVIYGLQGDQANEYWKKLAYGLKARYTMRLSYVNSAKYTYQDVITFAGKSFLDASEQAAYTYNGATSYNPYHLLFNQRDMYGASTSLNNNMNAADPRIAKYFISHPNASALEFAPNGTPEQLQGRYGVSSYFSDPVQATYLMSFHELKFLEAEASERITAGSGKAIMDVAITAAMKAAGIADTDINAYLTVIAGETADAKYIVKEKYIASFIVESLEAYADMRRMNAMGEGDYITLENPQPAKFPLRFTYGADDVNNNTYVRDAQGDGRFIYTENVWWAGGSR